MGCVCAVCGLQYFDVGDYWWFQLVVAVLMVAMGLYRHLAEELNDVFICINPLRERDRNAAGTPSHVRLSNSAGSDVSRCPEARTIFSSCFYQ